jgi:hypothetical protein
LGGLEPPQQVQQGDLTFVLVTVVTAHYEHRRSYAVGDRGNRDEEMRPSPRVGRTRDLEVPDLPSGRLEVNRASDAGRVCHVAIVDY